MMAALDPNAPMDQLVCLQCHQRASHRHNIQCARCDVAMAYERAWVNLRRPEEILPELVQLGFFE